MKYVVAVNASPRTGRNTAMLAKKAVEGAEAAGAQVGCLQQKAGAICDCDPGRGFPAEGENSFLYRPQYRQYPQKNPAYET